MMRLKIRVDNYEKLLEHLIAHVDTETKLKIGNVLQGVRNPSDIRIESHQPLIFSYCFSYLF